MLLGRSRSVCIRAFRSFRRYSNRLTPLIVVFLLLSLLFGSLCVAIPYYLKLFTPKSFYRRFEAQRDLPSNGDYCPSCDDYVIGLFGHAPFLGVCIGLHNARHFLALLAYGILYSTIAAAITVPLAVQLLWEPSLLYRICFESHLGPLSLFYCHSWNSSQSFMLTYLLIAAAALSIAVSLVPVLALFMRFIVNGWSFSAPDNQPWISLFDRNFMHKFLRLPDRGLFWSITSTVVIPMRFASCDEFNR